MNQTTIEFSEMLQRRVRLGAWEDQKISTYRKIIEAINEKNWDHAADLADYFTDEANVCFSLYRQWINDLQNFLRKIYLYFLKLLPQLFSLLRKLTLIQ